MRNNTNNNKIEDYFYIADNNLFGKGAIQLDLVPIDKIAFFITLLPPIPET